MQQPPVVVGLLLQLDNTLKGTLRFSKPPAPLNVYLFLITQ